MLRSQSPALIRQELAAWAAAVEMTRDAALAAAPARTRTRTRIAPAIITMANTPT